MTITELTITRHNWLRGEGHHVSRLLRAEDKKMCCLGHFSLACGMLESSIFERLTPYSFGLPQLSTSEVEADDDLVLRLMRVNDNPSLSGEQREGEIAALMLKLNPPVKVTFID